jgi:hypothetical protein
MSKLRYIEKREVENELRKRLFIVSDAPGNLKCKWKTEGDSDQQIADDLQERWGSPVALSSVSYIRQIVFGKLVRDPKPEPVKPSGDLLLLGKALERITQLEKRLDWLEEQLGVSGERRT